MIRNFFNAKKNTKKQAKPPLAPIAAANYSPYQHMGEDEARKAMLTAVLNDDLHVARGIAHYHAGSIDWMIVAKGSSIGGAPIQAPLVLHAAGAGSIAVLQWMIDNNVDLEARSNLLNNTALYHAADIGQEESVRLLLKAGADPFTRAETPNPISALAAAERSGHEDIANLLRKAQRQPLAHEPASMQLRQDRVITAPRLSFKKN